MRVPFSLAFVLMAAMTVGCGEDGPKGATAADGGTAGSPGPDAKAPSNPAAEREREDACKGAKPGSVLLDGTNVSSLRASGGELFFVDRNAGGKWLFNTRAGALRAIAADGSRDRVLYAGLDDERLGDIWVDEQNVYVMVQGLSNELDGANIYRVPRSGGTPALFSKQGEGNYDELFAVFFASDSEYLYVSDASDLYRVAKATGKEQRIVEAGTLQPLVYQDKVWFTQGANGANGIFSVAKDAVDATPALYVDQRCSGLAVNAGGVFCYANRVANDGVEVELEDKLGSGGSMSASHMGKVYIASLREGPIVEADPVSLQHRTVACGATIGTTIQAMDSAIFWIETRTTDGKDIDKILRASL